MKDFTIRKGIKADVPQMLELIRELAAYERALDSVKVTEKQLIEDGFGSSPVFQFLVACEGQKIVGLSLFYYRYSTWKGKGLYLEDLVVKKDFRRQGIGKELMLETAKFAREQRCTGLYWQVLDWNTPAIEFYKNLGSEFDNEWINCKLDQQGLQDL